MSTKAFIHVIADRFDCHYNCGEPATLSITVTDEDGNPLKSGKIKAVADNYGSKVICQQKVFDLSDANPFSVSATKDTPGFLRWIFTAADDSLEIAEQQAGRPDEYWYSIVFDSEKIISGTPDPDDFDAFWRNAINNLDATVPVDAKTELIADRSANENFNYYRVSFASYNGRRVYGWLTEPKDLSKGPYPVYISVPGAGIGCTNPPAGKDGYVILFMNVHSYPQPEGVGPEADEKRQKIYNEQDVRFAGPCHVARYCHSGIHQSREDYFYYASILGINRAVTWLAGRPECDTTRFTYEGTSQGGGFGLILTALNPLITRSAIYVPAMTDLMGSKIEGRQSGWPQLIEAQIPENKADAEKWAPYFCGVNFARRIKTPIRFVAGFADAACSPNAVYSAFNACPSTDKAILDGIGMPHSAYSDFYDYLSAWANERSASEGEYRFLAFNIWGDYFGNPTQERAAREAAIVKKWNPDFAGFQEVTQNFWNSDLISDLEDEYTVIGRDLGPGGYWKNAATPVLFRKSRFDLIDSGAVWYCKELDGSKGAVWAVVKDKSTGKNIGVFASHYWWRYDGQGDAWIRLNNSQKLREKMFELSEKYNAAIVGGGDLNASIDSSALKFLLENGLSDAQQSSKIAPRQVPSEHGDPRRGPDKKYSGVTGIRGINQVKPRSYYLDHIFFDPLRITAERFTLDISREASAVSDHHPVILDFNLI